MDKDQKYRKKIQEVNKTPKNNEEIQKVNKNPNIKKNTKSE